MIAIHADALPVISSSETFSYPGRDVRVGGVVLPVLIGQLVSALLALKDMTLVVPKAIRLSIAVFILILTATHSQAGLGWTLTQLKQQYGDPVLDQEQIAGRTGYVFTEEDYIVAAFFRNTQVSRILYICRDGSVLDWARARALLTANAPEAIWDNASKSEADSSYRVNGTKDGVESYYASLTDDGKMLAIWTEEDDEAARTTPRPDMPSGSSVVGSNENRTGEVAAGQTPNSDSELTPERNHSGVPANASSSSPARQAASTHTFQTGTARVKLRPSLPRRETFHVATFDAKARSTAFSRQRVVGHLAAPTPTPLLMNAGTGLYNSDYTQPYKDPKKAPAP